MVGAHALVGIDHARQLPDEERAVVPQALREAARVGGVDLQVLGRDAVGIGDHGRPVARDRDLALSGPGGTCDRGGGQGGELPLHLGLDGEAEIGVGGDEAHAGADVVLGLGEEVGGDHLGVSGRVGKDVDFGRAGELVDADGPEDLAAWPR
jgi:hypothetical protein